MADAPRPTTLNSLTHYALTEDQQEVMEQGRDALRDVLAKTNTDPKDTRIVQAVSAGVLLPESVIRQETEPAPPDPKSEEGQRQEQENKEKQEQENKTRQQEQKREERHDDKRGR